MTDQEKIDLTIRAISEVRNKYPSICVKLDQKSKDLCQLNKVEILKALNKMEKEEKVITVYDSTSNSLPQEPTIGGRWEYDVTRKARIFKPYGSDADIIIEDNSITVRLHDNFDNWLLTRQFLKKQELKDLNKSNIEGIHKLIHLIKNNFETKHHHQLKFYAQNNHENHLSFLKNKDVISDHTNEYKDSLYTITLTLNVTKFLEFIPKIDETHKQQSSETDNKIDFKPLIKKEIEFQERKYDSNETLYQITFSANNEILLNDLVLIGKPNLNSENGNIFPFVFKNPNRTISKEEVEKHIGQSVGKDFHKIVENWGFIGDLKEIFFNVGNNSILFRNSIKKSDFEQIGVRRLKIRPQPQQLRKK